jgi:hypothetical protein
MIYVLKCDLPPPIECTQQRSGTTGPSWVRALPFPFRSFGDASWSSGMRTCGQKRVLDGTAPEVLDLQSHRIVVLLCLPTAPGLPFVGTETSVRRRYLAALGQARCLPVRKVWDVGPGSTIGSRDELLLDGKLRHAKCVATAVTRSGQSLTEKLGPHRNRSPHSSHRAAVYSSTTRAGCRAGSAVAGRFARLDTPAAFSDTDSRPDVMDEMKS